MRIQFTHPADPQGVVPWQVDEHITLRIVAVDDDTYTAETVETMPPDIRERHAAELAAVHAMYQGRVES